MGKKWWILWKKKHKPTNLRPHLEVCFHRTFGDALHFGLVRRKAWFRELRELPQLGSL